MKKLLFLFLIIPFFASAQIQTDAAITTQNNSTVRQVTLSSKNVANMLKTINDSKISLLTLSINLAGGNSNQQSNFSASNNLSNFISIGTLGSTLSNSSYSLNPGNAFILNNSGNLFLKSLSSISFGTGSLAQEKMVLDGNGNLALGGTITNASTAFDILSTTKALKLGSAARASVTTPATGMITNDTNVPYFHNGTAWNVLAFGNTQQTLTDAATTTWDLSLGNSANWTVGGNRTLSVTNIPTGPQYGTVKVTQDATGGRTITLPGNSNDVLLRTGANAITTLSFYYDGSAFYWNSTLKGDAFLANTQTFAGKNTFTPNSTSAGINVGSFAGDPSSLNNADIWYNSTTNALRSRINGVSTDLTIPNLFSTTVTVSSAQILNSFTTPIALVPAQGAGNVIIPVQIVASLTFGGAGYTGNTTTQIQLNATNVASVSGFIGNTSNTFINLDLPQVALGAASANVPLNFTTQTGNPSAGNGTLKIFVLYRIVTL